MNGVGIINALPDVVIEVQDMLCAQALAVVAQAASRLQLNQGLLIYYNSKDVGEDLLAWAHTRGYLTDSSNAHIMFLTRRSP